MADVGLKQGSTGQYSGTETKLLHPRRESRHRHLRRRGLRRPRLLEGKLLSPVGVDIHRRRSREDQPDGSDERFSHPLLQFQPAAHSQ